MNQVKKDKVILVRTHFLNEAIVAQFQGIKDACGDQYDVIFLCDNTNHEIKGIDGCPIHYFNMKDVPKMGYRLWKGRELWFHMDYAVLHFFLEHPYYRYYWVLEYDVRFEGNWGSFFASFQEDDSDVLSTYVRAYEDDPRWRWWNEHNLNVEKKRWLAIFCPVIRFSKKALQVLHDGHKAGVCGYGEVVIPTLARESGLRVRDIGERFYDPLSSFNFNGVIFKIKGKLAHPVKDTELFNKAVSLYRYIFRARYDSHWSIRAAQFLVFKVLHYPQRQY